MNPRTIALVVGLLGVMMLAGIALVVYPPSTGGQSIIQGSSTDSDADFGSVMIYAVQDDGTLAPAPTGTTAEVWELFTRVATVHFAAETVRQFRTGDAPGSDTLAYVYQDADPTYWILATNLAGAGNRTDTIATLVHEYAHILTLGVDEVDPFSISCSTVELDEGCATDDSAVWAFQQRFWAPYGDSAPPLDNVDSDLAYDFYLDHEDDFVDDYAATNALEDLAETFMTWVVEDDPEGEGVVAQKLAFLDEYPELSAIRERIRTEFADDLGLTQ